VCRKSPLSSLERAGVRGINNLRVGFIYPHPNLLPEGEGLVFDFYGSLFIVGINLAVVFVVLLSINHRLPL